MFIIFLMIEYGIHRNLGPYDLTKLPINFVEVFKFVWLSIIAYDYLVVIRWDHNWCTTRDFFFDPEHFRSEVVVNNVGNRFIKYLIGGFVTALILSSIETYLSLPYYSSAEFFVTLILEALTALIFIVFLIVWRVRRRQINAGLQSNVSQNNQTLWERYLFDFVKKIHSFKSFLSESLNMVEFRIFVTF